MEMTMTAIATNDLNDNLDDLIGAPWAKPVAAAQVPATAPVAAGGLHWQACPKCNGTGRYLHFGACFACQGRGGKAFKQSAAVRAANRAKAADRRKTMRVAQGDEAEALLAASHPAVLAWIKAAAGRGNEFGSSLLSSLRGYGSLTERQVAAIERIVSQEAERAAQGQAYDAAGARPAPLVMPRTLDVVAKFARVTVGEIGIVKKNAEDLWWIKSGDTLVGRLDAQGAALFGRRIREAGLETTAIRAALEALEADPLAAIKAHGLATGTCGCCGRELTDPVSIERGIGPICADRLGE
jgi:hypothetical protein